MKSKQKRPYLIQCSTYYSGAQILSDVQSTSLENVAIKLRAMFDTYFTHLVSIMHAFINLYNY